MCIEKMYNLFISEDVLQLFKYEINMHKYSNKLSW